jgi:hypothetical protein
VPPQHSDLVALLRTQGVVVFRRRAEWRGPADRFTVDSVNNVSSVFEGHRAVTVSGKWSAAEVVIPAGWYYCPTTQRLGVFAAYLLEPMSEDGFVTWNFLDRDLRSGEPYPILRVAQPLPGAMDLVQ